MTLPRRFLLSVVFCLVALTTFSCDGGTSSDSASPTSSTKAAKLRDTFVDARDGKSYPSVVIGTQTWMADNLNYAGPDSIGICPSHDADTCAKYGRRYQWSEATEITEWYLAIAKSVDGPSSPSIRGICPLGWHLPGDYEWTILQKFVDSTGSTDALKLKSKDGWGNDGNLGSGNGTDVYGFHALPRPGDDAGHWWTSTITTYPSSRGMYSVSSMVSTQNMDITDMLSVRCVKDQQ